MKRACDAHSVTLRGTKDSKAGVQENNFISKTEAGKQTTWAHATGGLTLMTGLGILKYQDY